MDIAALRSANPDHWNKAAAIRALTLDAIHAANSGHSGMPMGMADVATVLFEKHMKFDASAPLWADRDRFILSAGHGSMLLYSLLYLVGDAQITLDQVKNFRQKGALTAGHPENFLADAIETTTGPLGQGIANSVGFAMAEEIQRARYGKKIVDHNTYVIAGDGCLKKNDVMGFSTFFELPPPEAGLPRFILARPARSRPRVARPTEWPLQRSRHRLFFFAAEFECSSSDEM